MNEIQKNSNEKDLEQLLFALKFKWNTEQLKKIKEKNKEDIRQMTVYEKILGTEIFQPDTEIDRSQNHGHLPKPNDCSECNKGNVTFRCKQHSKKCLCGKKFSKLDTLNSHIRIGQFNEEEKNLPEYRLDMDFKEIQKERKKGLQEHNYFRPNSEYWKKRLVHNLKLIGPQNKQLFIDWYFYIVASGSKAVSIVQKIEKIQEKELTEIKKREYQPPPPNQPLINFQQPAITPPIDQSIDSLSFKSSIVDAGTTSIASTSTSTSTKTSSSSISHSTESLSTSSIALLSPLPRSPRSGCQKIATSASKSPIPDILQMASTFQSSTQSPTKTSHSSFGIESQTMMLSELFSPSLSQSSVLSPSNSLTPSLTETRSDGQSVTTNLTDINSKNNFPVSQMQSHTSSARSLTSINSQSSSLSKKNCLPKSTQTPLEMSILTNPSSSFSTPPRSSIPGCLSTTTTTTTTNTSSAHKKITEKEEGYSVEPVSSSKAAQEVSSFQNDKLVKDDSWVNSWINDKNFGGIKWDQEIAGSWKWGQDTSSPDMKLTQEVKSPQKTEKNRKKRKKQKERIQKSNPTKRLNRQYASEDSDEDEILVPVNKSHDVERILTELRVNQSAITTPLSLSTPNSQDSSSSISGTGNQNLKKSYWCLCSTRPTHRDLMQSTIFQNYVGISEASSYEKFEMVGSSERDYYLVNCTEQERFEALMQSLFVEYVTFSSVQNPWTFVCSKDDAYVYVRDTDLETGREKKTRISLTERLTNLLQGRAKNWPSSDRWWFFGWGNEKMKLFREQVFIFQILNWSTPGTRPSFRALRGAHIICARNLSISSPDTKFLCVLADNTRQNSFQRVVSDGDERWTLEFKPAYTDHYAQSLYPCLKHRFSFQNEKSSLLKD